VLIAAATVETVDESVEYIGRTVAVNDVSLRAQVAGYLKERRFSEGQDVDVGMPLFLIDPAIYQAQVSAAEGAVAEVQASLLRANQDVQRQTNLVKENAGSTQRLEEAEESKLTAEAKLMSVQAELEKAEIDLGHTLITAPISGRIGRAIFSVGDLVDSQAGELARLVELDPIYVNFSVSEGDIITAKRRLLEQNKGVDDLESVALRLRLPDGSLFDQVGRIDFIDNVVDRNTGTVIVRAKFDNPEKLLVPGLYVRALLSSEEEAEALTIPQSAVQEDQAGTFVMVVGPGNKVEQRRIKTGRADAGQLVVTEGLEPDEKVIVEGIQKVRPGIVVDPRMSQDPRQGNPDPDPPSPEASETKAPTEG
jgi:membrane fusion protein (multidrug efflux system)